MIVLVPSLYKVLVGCQMRVHYGYRGHVYVQLDSYSTLITCQSEGWLFRGNTTFFHFVLKKERWSKTPNGDQNCIYSLFLTGKCFPYLKVQLFWAILPNPVPMPNILSVSTSPHLLPITSSQSQRAVCHSADQ